MVPSVNYKYVFLFIVALYCLVLTQFGLENFDTGYIPSFSWRIVNGASVYEDFIYKGPPVTLYFHAFFIKILPETAQFLQIRILVYLMFALQVCLFVNGFNNLYDLAKSNTDKWAIICVAFVVSLLNFPPYPWPTTDGLLFASIAFWLVSKYKDPGFLLLLAIAFCCVLSALTKQSFYLVPVFFLFWIGVRYPIKKAVLFLFQLGIFFAGYFCFILSITNFENFIRQTTGETPLHYLFYSGLHNYIFIPILCFAAILLITAIVAYVYLRKTRQKITALLPFLKWTSVAFFAAAFVLCLFKEMQIASRIAFDGGIMAVIYAFGFDKKKLADIAPFAVALGIAWSCSISLGYPYPILFATGIIWTFVALIGKDLNINRKQYFWIALPLCLIAMSYHLRPYRETGIFTLNQSLETISPKLKYIKTNKDSFEKYSELKMLIGKYGENFIVAPNIPMANYLFNDQSELPADWIIETEIDSRQKEFIRLAANKKNYIFLEKSFLNREECMPEKREAFSSISYFIYKKFNLIGETKHFMIYNSLQKDARLP